MGAEMLLVAGEQVRGLGLDGRLENRLIFPRQINAGGKGDTAVVMRTLSRSLASLTR